MTRTPPDTIQRTLADSRLQSAVYAATGRLLDKRRGMVAETALPDFEELRAQANRIKQHTLENLDFYLEQLVANVTARGGKVIFAKDGGDVVDFIGGLAKEKMARRIVKSKSMTTEEIDLTERLENQRLDVVETDLGEYINQLAGHRPYHIVAPALHMTRYDVAALFSEKLGVEEEVVIEKQAGIARRVLREKFLEADIGISGANFLVADSGALVLVTNEGNGRLTTTLPKVHIAVAGIEKLIPRAQDLPVFLKLLGRSATGQALSVYTTFLAGPRREDEADGPDEFYLVLLDNGRTRLLSDRGKRESLYCIRCGGCLNVCPVYRKIGGHSYPWVYSGPIGAILTPQYLGVAQDPWLPFASSLCGACYEVCPVKINIPKILLDLRAEVTKATKKEGRSWLERLGFRAWAWVVRRPWLYEMMGMMSSALSIDGQRGRWVAQVPALLSVGPLKAWLSNRDWPAAPDKQFRQLWQTRSKETQD